MISVDLGPAATGMFTTRAGGVSAPPYRGLNLGGMSGDDPQAVARNRQIAAQALGAPITFADQVHGIGVLGPEQTDGEADVVLGTDRAVGVLVADCVPVLLVDRTEGLAAAVHAGRPGMMSGVVTATVRRLRELGASTLEAVVGPSVCPRCYEVPEPMRSQAAEVEPVAASVTREGTPAVDVGAGVVEQLTREGVQVTWLPGCTRERDDLYSYRRDGATGRFAGVIRLLAPEQAA